MRLLASALTALVVSVLLTLVVRSTARRFGVVAKPRDDRWHRAPTALLGGVAIFVAFSATYALLAPRLAAAYPILTTATLLFLLGLLDDLRPLKPYVKVVLQVVGAVGLVGLGLRLPWTAYDLVNVVVTIFWLVGITNAVNLLDNMDGLAGGITVIACVCLTVNFLASGQYAEAFLPAVLAGAVLGFLVFNVNPASIFMGDAGALFLGFLLAGTALLSEYGRSRSVAAVFFTPVLIFLIPIFDTSFVTLTRKLRAQPVSQGGRDHTSHRLVALGMSERRAVTKIYTFALISGALALGVRFLGTEIALLLVPAFGIGVLFLGLYLGAVRIASPNDLVPSGGTIIRALAHFQHKRRVFEVLLDIVLVALAYYAAYLLRFDGAVPWQQTAIFARTLPMVIGIQMVCFLAGGLYRGIWRYASIDDLATIGKCVVAGAVLNTVVIFALHEFAGPSRAVVVLNGIMLFILVSATRLSFRLLRTWAVGRLPARPDGRPLVIYGAGDGGALLVRELLNNAEYGYTPLAFIDDDAGKAGRLLHGFPVYRPDRLEDLVRRFSVEDIVISSAKIPEHRLDDARQLGLRLRHLRISLD